MVSRQPLAVQAEQPAYRAAPAPRCCRPSRRGVAASGRRAGQHDHAEQRTVIQRARARTAKRPPPAPARTTTTDSAVASGRHWPQAGMMPHTTPPPRTVSVKVAVSSQRARSRNSRCSVASSSRRARHAACPCVGVPFNAQALRGAGEHRQHRAVTASALRQSGGRAVRRWLGTTACWRNPPAWRGDALAVLRREALGEHVEGRLVGASSPSPRRAAQAPYGPAAATPRVTGEAQAGAAAPSVIYAAARPWSITAPAAVVYAAQPDSAGAEREGAHHLGACSQPVTSCCIGSTGRNRSTAAAPAAFVSWPAARAVTVARKLRGFTAAGCRGRGRAAGLQNDQYFKTPAAPGPFPARRVGTRMDLNFTPEEQAYRQEIAPGGRERGPGHSATRCTTPFT